MLHSESRVLDVAYLVAWHRFNILIMEEWILIPSQNLPIAYFWSAMLSPCQQQTVSVTVRSSVIEHSKSLTTVKQTSDIWPDRSGIVTQSIATLNVVEVNVTLHKWVLDVRLPEGFWVPLLGESLCSFLSALV